MTEDEKYINLIEQLFGTQACFETDNFGQVVIYTGLKWNEDYTKLVEYNYDEDDLNEDEN